MGHFLFASCEAVHAWRRMQTGGGQATLRAVSTMYVTIDNGETERNAAMRAESQNYSTEIRNEKREEFSFFSC
jgi:hypothetical protein